jgi:hypothetical protein
VLLESERREAEELLESESIEAEELLESESIEAEELLESEDTEAELLESEGIEAEELLESYKQEFGQMSNEIKKLGRKYKKLSEAINGGIKEYKKSEQCARKSGK